MPPPPPLSFFHVLLIGAGEINFGSPEGPWNHTKRLEALLGQRLRVVGLLDPDKERAQAALRDKQRAARADDDDDDDDGDAPAWRSTACFTSVEEAKRALEGQAALDLIIIGCPPHIRGTTLEGKDVDVKLLRAFPCVKAILVEKPIAAIDPTTCSVSMTTSVIERYATHAGTIGVGYVLRYLKSVQKIKQILRQHNLTPMCINARYYMAYEFARKLSWWNKDVSCGPVVEQATHFVDLIRYFADSPCLLDTVKAHTVEHDERAGQLTKQGFDEAGKIEASKRVPRITTASWKHVSGTIGTLCHAIALHGTTYDTQIDILADGWLLRLTGAYTESPCLEVIQPGGEGGGGSKVFREIDDPFTEQLAAFIRPSPSPLSSFEDALETYKLTWAIRKAGERCV